MPRPVTNGDCAAAATMMLGGAIVLGLLVGSFLNVCILRIPAGESIISPRSRCPRCETPLPWWANVPVASFVALRGRCAFCGTRISPRYAVVELLTAGLFAGVYWRFGASLQGAIAAGFAATLVVVTFIDIDHRIIPDVISLPGTAVGFALSWVPGGVSPIESAVGLLIGGGFLAAVAAAYAWWTRRGGLGLGDVKLLAMIGAFLGWTAIPATVVIGSLAGSAVGVPAILIRGRHLRVREGVRAGIGLAAMVLVALWILDGLLAPPLLRLPSARTIAIALLGGALGGLLVTVRRAARRFPIPFGPFLALGALASLFFAPEIAAWYARGL
jgi:leader peptidase (prepilin peptidase)/N-methyltransferase